MPNVSAPALVGAAPARLAVSTTDLLKLAGVVLFLTDHVGLYFDTDGTWWRVVGRVAAPIFFFLIGFARTRFVPWTWLWLGLVLTFVEGWTSGNRPGGYFLNILINFALIRLALDFVERRIVPSRARVVAFALGAVLLVRPLDPFLEYGAEGWLWALFGLAQRLAVESEDARFRTTRTGLAILTASVYVVAEVYDHTFGTIQSVVLGVLIAALTSILVRFRRTDAPWQFGAGLGTVVRTCGRRSLEIYAGSLLVMQLSSYALGFR